MGSERGAEITFKYGLLGHPQRHLKFNVEICEFWRTWPVEYRTLSVTVVTKSEHKQVDQLSQRDRAAG